MSLPNLLEKIKLEKFYQAGTILSFLIFVIGISLDVKVLNNTIISLFSLSLTFVFLGFWMGYSKEADILGLPPTHAESFSKNRFSTTSFLIAFIIFILGLFQLYNFFY